MNIRVLENELLAGKAAAIIIASQIMRRPESVLGLSTGNTPVDTYQELVRMSRSGIIDWSRVKTFNLDEYLGLPAGDEKSYHHYMQRHLFDNVNIRPQAINIPDGMAKDPEAECLAYERKIIEAGGIDLLFLGIGRNGHIGYNEPGGHFISRTHPADLSDDTIEDNSRFFPEPDDVPRQALSMGIGTIMKAKSIVLLATGSSKARAVANMLQGNISPLCPASILQSHSNVTVLLDHQAAVALNR